MKVIGIFGGTSGTDEERTNRDMFARELGGKIASFQDYIVLTGGDEPCGDGVKNKALNIPDKGGTRRWIGVPREGRTIAVFFPHAEDKGGRGVGLVLHTGFGHERNFLEACWWTQHLYYKATREQSLKR